MILCQIQNRQGERYFLKKRKKEGREDGREGGKDILDIGKLITFKCIILFVSLTNSSLILVPLFMLNLDFQKA